MPFSIQWLEEKLPGGGDRTFFIGLTEQAFQYWALKTRSINFPNLTYSYAAIYFQKNNVDEVLCAFEKTDGCEIDPILPSSDILLNKDVFKQISQFITQSRLAQSAIIILVLSFSTGYGSFANLRDKLRGQISRKIFGNIALRLVSRVLK